MSVASLIKESRSNPLSSKNTFHLNKSSDVHNVKILLWAEVIEKQSTNFYLISAYTKL